MLSEYLTAPHPADASLHAALHLHGRIERIPSVGHVVFLARSHRVRSTLGTYSVHRVAPRFSGGFEVPTGSQAKVATPEKALLLAKPARRRGRRPGGRASIEGDRRAP